MQAAQNGRRRMLAQVSGVVQGVGFRPFVYNLALAMGLTGYVTNTAAGVELAVQGPGAAVDEFMRRLRRQAPPLARIDFLRQAPQELQPGEDGFEIRASQGGARRTLISPDVAMCEDCQAELTDKSNRRCGHPFINCTHCGPRYTIIMDLPYDRATTTMAGFAMCEACRREYEDPTDRRFHAQPIACPDCGPVLQLVDPSGAPVLCSDPLMVAARGLQAGEVLAIKGLGGFHLAADATNEDAVQRLRGLKHREEKPLAVMVQNAAAAQKLAAFDRMSLRALTSRERPIVLAPRLETGPLAPGVAPGMRTVGLMLAYTPLHYLLLEHFGGPLVMTSGNMSDEPICMGNAEALARLGSAAGQEPICDRLLLHDRGIHIRCDDSVVQAASGRIRLLRRARGYAPSPLLLPPSLAPTGCPQIVAAGAMLKNTFCLLRGREAFVSQHIGDLEDMDTMDYLRQTSGHLVRLLEMEPGLAACDMHPDYPSTRWAEELGLPLVRVQHHHAHALAVMAEHGFSGEALALALDGTGYGPDRTVWGGEMLLVRRHSFRRLGRLRHFHLPGGDRVVREIWRSGLSLLMHTMGPEAAAGLELPLVQRYGEHIDVLGRMMRTGLNAPVCSSLGRLFDGMAAICGLRYETRFEGQAAMELDQIRPLDMPGLAYEFPVAERGRMLVLDWERAVSGAVRDVMGGREPGLISSRFHKGLADGLLRWALAGAEAAGTPTVVLGGGCLANTFLLQHLERGLRDAGLAVCSPQHYPPGDGAVSLGQAIAAAGAWQEDMVKQKSLILPWE